MDEIKIDFREKFFELFGATSALLMAVEFRLKNHQYDMILKNIDDFRIHVMQQDETWLEPIKNEPQS